MSVPYSICTKVQKTSNIWTDKKGNRWNNTKAVWAKRRRNNWSRSL